MPAVVTLSTTTLTNGIGPGTGEIKLASVSGIYPGYCLWIDRELFKVNSLPGGTRVKVTRGWEGTAGSDHSSSATVYIGKPEYFYSTDPVGAPPVITQVAPYINVISGRMFYAQGDANPSAQNNRWWEEIETTHSTGALGVRTQESAPTSST